MAVLAAMDSPGRALRMELAADLGSFCGGWASWRRVVVVVKVVSAGAAVRIGRVGRVRAAPVGGSMAASMASV